MPSKHKRLTIAIDIDDVLSDSVSALVEYSNAHWGTQITVSDYDENFAKMWNIDFAEVERRYEEYVKAGMILRLNPVQQAFVALTDLHRHYRLIIITSRRKALKSNTIRWITDNFPGIFNEDDIYFAGIWDKCLSEAAATDTKGNIVLSLGADYLIDDQVKHCISVANSGVKALLFGDYPWNQYDGTLPNSVVRVKNWAEVKEYYINV